MITPRPKTLSTTAWRFSLASKTTTVPSVEGQSAAATSLIRVFLGSRSWPAGISRGRGKYGAHVRKPWKRH